MTDLEQLFREAAELAEQGHPTPGDPLGRVAQARTRRRRRLTAMAVPLAAITTAAVALLPSLLSPGNDDGESVVSDPAAPATFAAVVAGRAGIFDATDGSRVNDLGPAAAVASAPDGIWMSTTNDCSSILRFVPAGRSKIEAELPVAGLVTSIAVSPNGGTIAYTVARAGDRAESGPACGSPDLVLRDARTGDERRWTGAAGSGAISQLTWSADGEQVAFQRTECCDGAAAVHVLDARSTPTRLTDLPRPVADTKECRYALPAYMTDQLVVARDCDEGTDVVRVEDNGHTSVVRRLPGEAVALTAAGKTLLVALQGTAGSPGTLLRLDPGGDEVPLGTGFSQPTWVTRATGTTDLSPAPTPTAEPGPSTSCTYSPRPPEQVGRSVGTPPSTPTDLPGAVTIRTNRGDISVTLLTDQAPCTVNSFAHLARSSYYDDTPCFRLTTQGIFVVQCGDPSGKGTGGPGYMFADEHLAGTTYPAGTVAMANSGPGTNGSQFFICWDDMQLDPNYTVFGRVTAGLDVLRQVAAGGAEPAGDGKPKLPLTISAIDLG
jgi:peptidyl-prolyl cis-trans isomerase B (cyclophilin B)